MLFYVLGGGVIWGQNSEEGKKECNKDTIYSLISSLAGFRMKKRRCRMKISGRL